MLYIERWLKAPFQLLDGELESRDKGTPQGGVISPLLMNLFLHYVFDRWIVGRYPNNPFVRYADDGVVHCRSESEARELKESLEARFSECNLELNLDKTKIVYCKDSNRTQNYQSISFDFLGYTFRGRLAKSKVGKYFNSFSPAISRKATKKIGDEMRKWKIPRWTNATLEDLGSKANPKLRGWYQYFGNYYPSELNRHLRHFNRILSKWAQRKYRKLRSQRRAQAWLGQVAKRETQLFYHWGKGILPTG
jgi:group II intron reverse transcriptase/maturase